MCGKQKCIQTTRTFDFRLNIINGDSNNHKLTEYFPVRRSIRKTQKTVLEEKQRSLEVAVRNGVEDDLVVCRVLRIKFTNISHKFFKIRHFEDKGRGVVAAKDFNKGDFVVEYSGDLIDIVAAKLREEQYAKDGMGCYMYYFKHNDQQYW